jgi:hypothetical protein
MLEEKNVSTPSVLAPRGQYTAREERVLRLEVLTARDDVARVVHKDIFELIIMAMNDGHRPHLTSQKPYAFDHRVG